MPTATQLHDELAPQVLAGLEGHDRERGDELLEALLQDWVREAETSGIGDRVLAILRADLDTAMQGQGPRERLAILHAEVLDRELRVVSRESLALGKQVIDETVSDEEARQRGEALLTTIKELAPRIEELEVEARRAPLRRQLEEAMLDALYAVERKAMSSRLNLYLRDRQTRDGDVPAPRLSP